MKDLIEQTVAILAKGKSILCPTDTVWGLSADATNFEAVEKLFELKNRPKEKSFVILVPDIEMLYNFVENVPDNLKEILASFDKPVSVIYPKTKNLASNALAADKSVAIRVVQNDFCSELIQKFGKPIISTSANISGETTPLTFDEISSSIKEKVDFVVPQEYDLVKKSAPSAIIRLENNQVVYIRR